MLNLNLIIKKIYLNSCNVLETIIAYKTWWCPKQPTTTLYNSIISQNSKLFSSDAGLQVPLMKMQTTQ